jgi:hypothetical protein
VLGIHGVYSRVEFGGNPTWNWSIMHCSHNFDQVCVLARAQAGATLEVVQTVMYDSWPPEYMNENKLIHTCTMRNALACLEHVKECKTRRVTYLSSLLS